MALYEFESKDGHRIELVYSMREAPRIGDAVTHRGETYRRVPSTGGRVRVVGEIRCNQIGPGDPDVPEYDGTTAVFKNHQEQYEWAQKRNAREGGVDWVLEK